MSKTTHKKHNVMSPFPIKGKGRGWVIPLAVMQSISIYRTHLRSSKNFYKSFLQTGRSYGALLKKKFNIITFIKSAKNNAPAGQTVCKKNQKFEFSSRGATHMFLITHVSL